VAEQPVVIILGDWWGITTADGKSFMFQPHRLEVTIEMLLGVAHEVVKVSEQMETAGVGGLGLLEIQAREALEAWNAEG